MPEQLLQPDQIPLLEKLVAKANSDTIQHRARILLLYNEGKDTREISKTVGLSPRTVRHWRREFLEHGMDIFPPSTEFKGSEKLSEKPTKKNTATLLLTAKKWS